MDRALTDQKDIPWFEMVGFSLNVIGDFSGKKDDDLVKIMVMVRKFTVCAICFKLKTLAQRAYPAPFPACNFA